MKCLLFSRTPREDRLENSTGSVWFTILLSLPLLALAGASFPVVMGLLFATGLPILLGIWAYTAHQRHHDKHHGEHI